MEMRLHSVISLYSLNWNDSVIIMSFKPLVNIFETIFSWLVYDVDKLRSYGQKYKS